MNFKGFTVIEMMIVISIIGILAAVSLPSFESFLRKRQMVAASNSLYINLYLARSEAVKRNETVTICKSTDSLSCGGAWTDGWLMFEDKNSDGKLDNSEAILGSGTSFKGYTLSWTPFGSDKYIRFYRNGMTTSHNGTFKFCPLDGDSKFATAVIVSKTARIRISRDSDQNGIREDASGDDLIC